MISKEKVHGKKKTAVYLLFLSILLFCFSPNGFAENSYLESLLQEAQKKQLHKDRYWHIILHYKTGLFGTESLIDDPRFFLAKDGKTNPETELRETIKSFFLPENQEAEHGQCRFILRYHWLREKLSIDDARLPKVSCKEYNDVARKVFPKSASLVFPSYFMNRPASMFGHTFIRIDNEYQSKLLGHAVNYSAFTGESAGFLYALKGVFGYYKGFFSVLPYYEKVKEYSDIEQRDMWEYNLNLTEAELQRMLMHIWELKDIYSYYYFLDENCSYNLFFLLEAGRPSLNLTDAGYWVIPVDTVRAVINNNAVMSVNFRPSKATMLEYIASQLSQDEKEAALELAEGTREPESLLQNTRGAEKTKMILDLAAELTQYKSVKKEISKEEYKKRFISILKARSTLGKTKDDAYSIPVPAQPDKGHNSARLGIGFGKRGARLFQELRLRPALHDIMDPDDGYPEGSQIIFTDIRARYYSEEHKLKFEGIDFIDILSISPRSTFFKPFSWKVSTGITQMMLADGDDYTVYNAHGGYGVAFQNSLTGLYYVFAETDVNLSRQLKDSYSLGIGATTGFIKKVTSAYKINLSVGSFFYELGDRHKTYEGKISQNFKINTDNSITVDFSRMKTYDRYQNEGAIRWNIYF